MPLAMYRDIQRSVESPKAMSYTSSYGTVTIRGLLRALEQKAMSYA